MPSEPKSNSRDFADGLMEWIESKAGRPIPELHDKNGVDDVDDNKVVETLSFKREVFSSTLFIKSLGI